MEIGLGVKGKVLGEKRAEQYKEKLSKNTKEWFQNLSEKEKQKFSKKISESLKESDKNIGGVREGTNKWRGCYYYNENENKEVWLDSSWERNFVEYLDKNGVDWERNTKKFAYKFKGKDRNYIPDFYLPSKKTYVEIKGYKEEKDKAKWRDFPHDLEVLEERDLNRMDIIE